MLFFKKLTLLNALAKHFKFSSMQMVFQSLRRWRYFEGWYFLIFLVAEKAKYFSTLVCKMEQISLYINIASDKYKGRMMQKTSISFIDSYLPGCSKLHAHFSPLRPRSFLSTAKPPRPASPSRSAIVGLPPLSFSALGCLPAPVLMRKSIHQQ